MTQTTVSPTTAGLPSAVDAAAAAHPEQARTDFRLLPARPHRRPSASRRGRRGGDRRPPSARPESGAGPGRDPGVQPDPAQRRMVGHRHRDRHRQRRHAGTGGRRRRRSHLDGCHRAPGAAPDRRGPAGRPAAHRGARRVPARRRSAGCDARVVDPRAHRPAVRRGAGGGAGGRTGRSPGRCPGDRRGRAGVDALALGGQPGTALDAVSAACRRGRRGR